MIADAPASSLQVAVVVDNDRRLAENLMIELQAFALREGLEVASVTIERSAAASD